MGFAAAILRRQLTLLPQSRAPQTLRRIAGDYPDSYGLTDRDETIEGMSPVSIQLRGGRAPWPGEIPRVPLNQVVAIAFTSGVRAGRCQQENMGGVDCRGSRNWIQARHQRWRSAAVVATVPHQHMFGLEASVMLPIMHGLVMHAGRPLFPADIRSALADVTGNGSS